MELIKKLPGLGDRGSGKRFLLASLLYISLLGCTALALLGTLVDSDDDQNDVAAETAVMTASPEPPSPTATPKAESLMITESHTDETVAFIEDEPLVRDAHISIDSDTVTIALQINHAATDEHARDVLDSAVRWLASQVAMSYDQIDPPSSDHLGGIWDHYTLQVGAGPDPETFYARGAKVPGSPHISWD